MQHERPTFYAHRGAAADLPENTLASFRRALELGAHAIETDAHLTRDGHVVLSHDPTGLRAAGVATEIRRATLAEVRRWDVGVGWVGRDGARPFAGQGITMPTLEEALVEFPGVRFNVDLKQREPDMVPAALVLLRRLGAQPRVLLASFASATLRAVRARGYEGPTSLGQSEVLEALFLPRALLATVRRPRGVRAQIPYRVGRIDLGTSTVLDRCHALGLRVDYWTVNAPAVARRLLALGADGIMTDDPAAIAPVFRERGLL